MTEVSGYTDQELIRLIKHDDESAFSVIYDRYWKELYLSARKVIESKPIAQDAVQEVFISLWNRRQELELESLRGWLFQAVRFQVFKVFRHEKISQKVMDRLSQVSREFVDNDPTRFRELEELIRKVIAALPDDQREFFLMNREDGKTYREIAQEKNVSVKTVEKKMSQALKTLNSELDNPVVVLVLFHLLTYHNS
jgi:RNA polymerase sigma-70 factor (family 1)